MSLGEFRCPGRPTLIDLQCSEGHDKCCVSLNLTLHKTFVKIVHATWTLYCAGLKKNIAHSGVWQEHNLLYFCLIESHEAIYSLTVWQFVEYFFHIRCYKDIFEHFDCIDGIRTRLCTLYIGNTFLFYMY